jgi:hypothetical protein
VRYDVAAAARADALDLGEHVAVELGRAGELEQCRGAAGGTLRGPRISRLARAWRTSTIMLAVASATVSDEYSWTHAQIR